MSKAHNNLKIEDGEIPDSQSILNPKEASKLWLDWLKKLTTNDDQ